MERENIDALWIQGSASNNPAMAYFTGTVHLSDADLIIQREEEPILYCNSMEREEAASTGLRTVVKDLNAYLRSLKEYGGNTNQAKAQEIKNILEDLGLSKCRISVYGRTELSKRLGVLNNLQENLPELELVGEGNKSILLNARATKDKTEIDRIRRIGAITTSVVGKTAQYLQNCQINHDEILVNSEGIPVTVGEVKRKIELWLTELGAENPQGTVFALGRDAGIPHSTGKADDQICLGKTIVFDIFPREAGGGYFFDFTRTWCLGYAPNAEAQLYLDVKEVYDQIMTELTVNVNGAVYQERTCELFEERGYPTQRQNYQHQSGYVHGLGHGLGLEVHERPALGVGAGPDDILSLGSVFTIEPGLYYPDEGMGCRLEDTVWVNLDGKIEILAEYSHDLVLPMKHWSE
jgi:Xaa-Pro aminopeptidase